MSETSLFNLVANALGLEPKLTIPLITPRSANIIRHYQRELDRNHLDRDTALDRCLGDMAGRNYKPNLEQRSEPRL